jgi:hypothetical protein
LFLNLTVKSNLHTAALEPKEVGTLEPWTLGPTSDARPRDSRLALAAGGVLLAAFAATAPWARVQWPAVPAFVAAYDTAVIVLDSITAWLLYAQYRQSGGRALLALFCGYTFTSWPRTG